MSRKKIIAGNWKMNMTPSEAVKLVETLKPLVANDDVDVVFCVPAIDILPVVEAAKGSNIQVGAENMYFEEKGAFTGEISPNMLTDAGVKYVVLGHSERREYFAETSETVNKKMLKAFEHGITPIMCCGETLAQREQGVTMDFIRQQVKIGFQGLTADQAKKERDDNTRPAFEDLGVDPTSYKTVFIGYPIWWYQMPMIIETLFDAYDFTGVTIVPFDTHEGSRDGGTYDMIREREPGATVLDGLTIRGSDVSSSPKDDIQKWLDGLDLD